MSDRRRTRTPRRPETMEARRWTLPEITALGVTTDVVTAGQILGMSRNTAYAHARCGTFPIPVIKAGRQYRVAVAALLAVLQPADTATDSATDGVPP